MLARIKCVFLCDWSLINLPAFGLRWFPGSALMQSCSPDADGVRTMSASAAIRQFLFEAQQRVTCHAIAFTPPSRDHFDFHCSAADAADVRRILETVADSFLLECRNRAEPVVSNRVRYEANGPLLGRFLASNRRHVFVVCGTVEPGIGDDVQAGGTGQTF